jgi:GT2 family glycosyltransferase
MLKKYAGCELAAAKRGPDAQCLNANVRALHVLTSPHNIGFAGSVNTGIKAGAYTR